MIVNVRVRDTKCGCAIRTVRGERGIQHTGPVHAGGHNMSHDA